MNTTIPLEKFAPLYAPDQYTEQDAYKLKPFFTNLTSSVYVPLISSPEVIGALCSRTSRAAEDLRLIFLNEYVKPFLEGTLADAEQQKYGAILQEYIDFLHKHPTESIFSNPKARSFYTKWLAQYGDDSIAQMAGMHVVFSSISQLAIKQFEDQRIGLAPIEKSTRYVDYSKKVNGSYKYYTDPTLEQLGLKQEYQEAMDTLFNTYTALIPKISAWLAQQFPEEKSGVIEKKAFDTVRGLLPVATLSQVAFFGNGQAFEYLVSRSARHSLGEVRWAAEQTYQELYKVAPSFLRRVKDEASKDKTEAYQDYLSSKTSRVSQFVPEHLKQHDAKQPSVTLVEYDAQGEDKIITGILYNADSNIASWENTLLAVQNMTDTQKRAILAEYLNGRTQRWQKVGRAFENAYLRYDIMIDIGAWRDLHRHRMLTQQRQLFTAVNGHNVPQELVDAGLDMPFRNALHKAAAIYRKIAEHDPVLAQYAIPMAYKVRFQQWTNIRECFWEMELRTIPEGHPDYRHVEQEKFRLFEKAYPLIAEHMHVNMGEYDFARRGQEEKIQAKLDALEKMSM
ncbi:MAG: FAD-dependent thymidylate synthase [Candidatus Andersenbacteria bacterium]